MRPAPKITPKFVVAVVEQAREIATEEASLRIPSRLGMAVVFASVALMGCGLMRSSGAQDVPKTTEPAASAAALQDPEPKRVPDAVKPAETPAPPLEPEVLPESSVPKLPETPVLGSPPAVEPASVALAATAGQNDDPEKTVQAFVEQNRKVAEAQLKGLKDEEQKLRGRLQKVEGGIKRWEALLAALDKSSPTGASKGLTLSESRVRERPRVRPRGGVPSAPREGPRELIEDLLTPFATNSEPNDAAAAPHAEPEKLPPSIPR